jgi:hypothetical protein
VVQVGAVGHEEDVGTAPAMCASDAGQAEGFCYSVQLFADPPPLSTPPPPLGVDALVEDVCGDSGGWGPYWGGRRELVDWIGLEWAGSH